MKAFLILEDGHVFEGKSIGSTDEIISEIVFNTSMTGYLEILTDPSYAGQSVCMTYPLIGNYGVCREDMEAGRPWQSGFIVRELCKTPSNFRSEMTINEFLVENNITGILKIQYIFYRFQKHKHYEFFLPSYELHQLLQLYLEKINVHLHHVLNLELENLDS